MSSPSSDVQQLAADLAGSVRLRMQEELMKSWRNGVRVGLDMAREMAMEAPHLVGLVEALALAVGEVEDATRL